jgi:two-component system, NtrC family, sensor kinase
VSSAHESDGERARRERDALLQLARATAAGSPSTRRALVHLAETAQAFVGAEGACVLELRHERYRVVAPTGITVPYDGQAFQIMPGHSLFREVLATQQVVVTNDGQHDPRVDPRFRDALKIRHLAVAPIFLRGQIDGLLLVMNAAHPDGFSADDAAFLGRLADFTALAMRDAELVQRADDAAAEARQQAHDAAVSANRSAVLARTAQVLATVEGPEAVYEQLNAIVRELLLGGGFAIYEADASTRRVRLAFQAGVGQLDPERVAERFWDMRSGDVIDKGSAVFVNDMTQGSPTELRLTEPLRRAGVQSLAMLPLSIAGRTAGVLGLRFLDRWAFDAGDQDFLRAFAAQVGQALRNARHLDELESRAARLSALATAQQRLSGVRVAEALPAAILDAVRLVVPHVVACELREVTDDSPPVAVHTSIAPDEGRDDIRMCVPLSSTHMLCAHTRRPSGFDGQDANLLAILARHAMQALETAQMLEAKETERRRAETAAAIARAALHAAGLHSGARAILELVQTVAPSVGMALGVARARDGRLEYLVASGALSALAGYRPPGPRGVLGLSPTGAPVALPSLRTEAPDAMRADVPDLPVLVLPLLARERAVGALVVVSQASPPWTSAERETLERLSPSIALAIDAMLLDEEERQARDREQVLGMALMTLDHPVFILDGDTIRFANPAASREYGWPSAQLVGRRFGEFVVSAPPTPPWERAPSADSTVPVALQAADALPTSVHRRRDGSEFPAAVTINPLRDARGVSTGAVVSVRDLTAERAQAEQLRHAEKMVALGELVAGVAHEINNPLTAISAFAELLLEDPLDGEQRESVEMIKRESERATAVIRDLLLFARKGETPVGPVDLNALVEQTIRLRGYAHRAAGLDVRAELAPDLPTVPGDSQRLHQVLLNLVTNAEHALARERTGARTTRTLTLRSEWTEHHVFVSVEDTGCGMTAEVQRRLFEPFFTTKPPGVGTGLGLSVSYGIAQAHGGTISVESELDVGTRVRLSLPRTAPELREPEPSRQRFSPDA